MSYITTSLNITTSLKSRLKLKSVCQERLSLNTFESDSFATRGCDVVTMMLRKPGINERLKIVVCISPVICSSLPSLVNVSKYAHIKCLDLADSGSLRRGDIDMLIGSDYYWQVVTGDIVNGDSGPVAISSMFGRLLSGPVDLPSIDSTSHSLVIIGKDQGILQSTKDNPVAQMLKRFWENESIGILDTTEGEQLNEFLPEIQFNGARYEIRLLWKESYPSSDILNHFHLCFNHLKYLQQSLLKSQMFYKHTVILSRSS